MSEISYEIYECPRCRKQQKFKIWKSISSNDTEGKSALLNGDLFNFRCIKCGHTAKASYTFLYNDLDNVRFIWYVPYEMNNEIKEELETFSLLGITQLIVHTEEELFAAIQGGEHIYDLIR